MTKGIQNSIEKGTPGSASLKPREDSTAINAAKAVSSAVKWVVDRLNNVLYGPKNDGKDPSKVWRRPAQEDSIGIAHWMGEER